jgi:hypothetical protein
MLGWKTLTWCARKLGFQADDRAWWEHVLLGTFGRERHPGNLGWAEGKFRVGEVVHWVGAVYSIYNMLSHMPASERWHFTDILSNLKFVLSSAGGKGKKEKTTKRKPRVPPRSFASSGVT